MEKEKCICEGDWFYPRDDLECRIIGNKISMDYRNCRCGAFEEKYEINYCPKCGKSLSENK